MGHFVLYKSFILVSENNSFWAVSILTIDLIYVNINLKQFLQEQKLHSK